MSKEVGQRSDGGCCDDQEQEPKGSLAVEDAAPVDVPNHTEQGGDHSEIADPLGCNCEFVHLEHGDDGPQDQVAQTVEEEGGGVSIPQHRIRAACEDRNGTDEPFNY